MIRSPKRTNQEWLDALSGAAGIDEQTMALNDLANYLFVVALNYLKKRQNDVLGLQDYPEEELKVLSEEFVQRYMEKMCTNDFALLEKYSGRGSFLAWAAQVTVHICSCELRLVAWHRNEKLEAHQDYADNHVAQPVDVVLRDQAQEVLVQCLAKLPERSRFALTQCIVEGKSAADVGEVLDISANAVHILVHRAKKRMRRYLEGEGFGGEVYGGSF